MSQQTEKTHAHVPAAGPPKPLERLGDEIAELSAHIRAATYRLLILIREFDEREGWGDGFRSCAHGLSWRPDGRPTPAAPVTPVLAENPLAALEQRHREERLQIDAETGLPSWDGGSWDLNWALYSLRSVGRPKAVDRMTEKRFRGNVHEISG